MLVRASSGGGGGVTLSPSASYKGVNAAATGSWTVDTAKDYILFTAHPTSGVKGYVGYIHNKTVQALYNVDSFVTVTISSSGTTVYVKNNASQTALNTFLVTLD